MTSLVTVIVGDVGNGFAPIAHYCKGTVYILSSNKFKENDITALKRDDLNLKLVSINFFNFLSSYKKIKELKNDILLNYGGIDVLINNCTYNFEANTRFPAYVQCNTLVNFNCLTIMKVCEVFFRLLKNGSSTVIYCALKYDYLCVIPNNNRKKTIQDNRLTSHQLKIWLNQYLEATEQNNYEAEWGNCPYAVSKAGFVALKNIHKRKLLSKGIKVFHDYGIQVGIVPVSDSLLLLLERIRGVSFTSRQNICQENKSPNKDLCELSTIDELSTVHEHSSINEMSSINEPSRTNVVECTIDKLSTINKKNENAISKVSKINEVSTVLEARTSELNTLQKKTKKRVLHDHKRGRTGNNTTISMTANKFKYLNVAVANLKADLTEEEATYIQKELQNALFAMCNQKTTLEQTDIPSFDKNPTYNEGVVKFWCHNEKSLAWLTENVAKLKLSRACQLDVIDQRHIPGRVCGALFIPDFNGNLIDLQALLYHQNPWYNINLWDLCSCEKTTIEKPSGTLLILNIPKEDAYKIMARKQRIHYAMGTINMKFIINTGFSNKAAIDRKSIVNNADNWQLIPIATEQNDISVNSIPQYPSLEEAIKEVNGFLENDLEFSWDES